MENEILAILKKELPENFNIIVKEGKNCFREPEIKIMFSPNTHEINRVKGQYPQVVSLLLDLTSMELNTQVFGCMGGGNVYRKPDLNHPREKYLAMARIKIPFKRPKKESKFVLSAIERFAKNYLKALKEHRETLMYQNEVDYSFLD